MIISDGRRLAYYQTKADSKFWDSHWSGLAKKVEWEKAEKGFLGWFEEPFTKFIGHGLITKDGAKKVITKAKEGKIKLVTSQIIIFENPTSFNNELISLIS